MAPETEILIDQIGAFQAGIEKLKGKIWTADINGRESVYQLEEVD